MMRVKSHILRREERGLLGLTFERLMGIGGGGFLAYLLSKPLQLTGFAIILPLLLGTSFAAYWLSEPEAVPRYLSAYYALRALILLAARRHADSFLAQIVKTLGLDLKAVLIDGDQLFYLEETVAHEEWSGIEILDEDDLESGGYEILNDDLIILSN